MSRSCWLISLFHLLILNHRNVVIALRLLQGEFFFNVFIKFIIVFDNFIELESTPFFFFFFRAAPMAYGNSQARGVIGAAAASLLHSHSNARSKSQFVATLNP